MSALKRNIIAIVAAGVAIAASVFFIPESFIAGLPFGGFSSIVVYAAVGVIVFGVVFLLLPVEKKHAVKSRMNEEDEYLLDRAYSLVNSLSDRDYDDFMNFLRSNNKPVLRQGLARGGLYGSEIMEHVKREEQHSNSYLYVYRIKPEVFEVLRRHWR